MGLIFAFPDPHNLNKEIGQTWNFDEGGVA